jgi:ligand-binding sensor domain-containing protein
MNLTNTSNKISRTLVKFFASILLFLPVFQHLNAQNVQVFGNGIMAKRFYSSIADNNNIVWFLTESGIISFNGSTWKLHNNPGIGSKELKQLSFVSSPNGQEIWVSGPAGAIMVAPPIESNSAVITYTSANSKIASDSVVATSGNKDFRWIGTDKGIFALWNNAWLKNDYYEKYPEDIFKFYPISSLAANPRGDSLYVGTIGGGVMRFYKNPDIDAISGASEFAVWGPIIIPSDSVYSVFIAADGTKWFGTNMGAAKHVGNNTLDGWEVYNTKSGLAGNMVQAINADSKGNVYFGTTNGLSVLNGSKWTTYRVENGLASNNILSIAVDRNDVVWLGTDNGVTSLKNGFMTSYQ